MEAKTETSGSIWSNRTFVKMFTAYSVATFGAWFDFVALSVLFGYIWKASPMVLALMPLTFAVPGILLGQVAGVVVDRWKKLHIMVICDLFSALVTLLLVFAPNVWWALTLMALRSAASAFNVPAQQALTRHVVAEEHLLKATTYNGLVNQTSKVLGPVLGAGLILIISAQAFLAVNAVCFLLSALTLLTIGKIPGNEAAPRAEGEEKSSFANSWKEGWGILLKTRMLVATIFFAFVASFAVQIADFQVPGLLAEILPNEPELMGWILGGIGLGSVAGLAVLNRRNTIKSYGLLMVGGVVTVSLLFLYLGYMRAENYNFLLLLAVSFICGIGNGLTSIGVQYAVQKETPKEAVGRVQGILSSLFGAAFIVAPLLGGVAVTAFGGSNTFFAVGATGVAVGVIGLLFQKLIWGSKKEQSAVEHPQSAAL